MVVAPTSAYSIKQSRIVMPGTCIHNRWHRTALQGSAAFLAKTLLCSSPFRGLVSSMITNGLPSDSSTKQQRQQDSTQYVERACKKSVVTISERSTAARCPAAVWSCCLPTCLYTAAHSSDSTAVVDDTERTCMRTAVTSGI